MNEIETKYIQLLEVQQEQLRHITKALSLMDNCHANLTFLLEKARKDPKTVTKNWLGNLYRRLEYGKSQAHRAKRKLTECLTL